MFSWFPAEPGNEKFSEVPHALVVDFIRVAKNKVCLTVMQAPNKAQKFCCHLRHSHGSGDPALHLQGGPWPPRQRNGGHGPPYPDRIPAFAGMTG